MNFNQLTPIGEANTMDKPLFRLEPGLFSPGELMKL